MKFRLLPDDPDQGWVRYAWLMYSVPFPIFALSPRVPSGQRTAMLLAYPVFLVLYFAGYWVRDRKIVLIVAAMDLMAMVFRANPMAPGFFIYGSAFIGSSLERREAVAGIVAQAVLAISFGLATDQPFWYYIPAVGVSVLIGAITMHGRESAIANARLRLAHAEVERIAKVAERERIARDLHDLLGHTLSVIVLKSELARRLMPADPTRAASELADVERTAREGLAEVRSAITGYRSSGLAAEIETVRATLLTAGIEPDIDARTISLAPAQETAIALALREAATNVIRHAQARTCRIRFYERSGHALLEVEDDGRGTDKPFGNGLIGMRERLVALGGALERTFARQSEKRGTRLHISLPLEPRPC